MSRTILEAIQKLNAVDPEQKPSYILEDLRGYAKNNYRKVFGDEKQVPDKQFDNYVLTIANIDPTFKGKDMDPEMALKQQQGSYFDWLMRLLKKGSLTYKDLMSEKQEFTDQLMVYDELKKKKKLPADKRDIMQIKSIDELMELLQSLGGNITAEVEHGANFKQITSNIRGALISICGFKDNEIPSDIQKTEDALTFLCETDKWEVYKINSIWGAMLADTYGIDWGGGATWCTGGQYSYVGEPRKGKELLASAERFYGNYTSGHYLVVFQQKNNSVLRPKNKAQLNVSSDNYRVSNFFHANDNAIGLNEDGKITYEGGYRYSSDTSAVLAAFLTEEHLLEAVKGTILGGCEAIADAENRERLERGEPYVYTSGKIKDSFRGAIKKLTFEWDGKKYTVDVEKVPNILQANSAEEMFQMKELSEGKPFVYSGKSIPAILKPAIKEVVFAENYKTTIPGSGGLKEVDNYLKNSAFSGCSNLQKITLPVQITNFLSNVFKGCPSDLKIIVPRFPNREFSFHPNEREAIMNQLWYDDGTKVIPEKAKK